MRFTNDSLVLCKLIYKTPEGAGTLEFKVHSWRYSGSDVKYLITNKCGDSFEESRGRLENLIRRKELRVVRDYSAVPVA